MGLTRDTATLMVGQYFKRRREAVEIALVGSSGIGLTLMTVFLHTTLGYVHTIVFFSLLHLEIQFIISNPVQSDGVWDFKLLPVWFL